MIGAPAAFALWLIGREHVWLVTAILTGAFGPTGADYTGLIVSMLFFGAVSIASQSAAEGLKLALARLDRTADNELIAAAIGGDQD